MVVVTVTAGTLQRVILANLAPGRLLSPPYSLSFFTGWQPFLPPSKQCQRHWRHEDGPTWNKMLATANRSRVSIHLSQTVRVYVTVGSWYSGVMLNRG